MATNVDWLSDDEFDEDIYSSEEEEEIQEEKRPSKYAGIDLDDDEDDTGRVTRTAQEKSWDELNKSIKILRHNMTTDNFNSIASEWENLSKAIAKASSLFDKQGIPRFLTLFLIELIDKLAETVKDLEKRKTLSPTNFRSLNNTNQKLKKWLATQPSQEARIQAFRDNPNLASEEEAAEALKAKSNVSGKHTGHHQHHGGLSSGHSGASYGTQKEDATVGVVNRNKLIGREKWLKRAGEDSSSSSSEDENDTDWLDDDDEDIADGTKPVAKKTQGVKPGKQSAALQATGAGKRIQGKMTSEAAGGFSDDEGSDGEGSDDEGKGGKSESAPVKEAIQWTPEKIDSELAKMIKRRGARNLDRIDEVVDYGVLVSAAKEKANTPDRLLKIYTALANAQFDVNPNVYGFLDVKVWKHAYNTLVLIFEILNSGQVQVVDSLPPTSASPSPLSQGSSSPIPVLFEHSVLFAQISRLDDEFVASLKHLDFNTQEYVARLKHETPLLKLLRLAFDYFSARGEKDVVSLLASKRLSHIYYYRRDSSQKSSSQSPSGSQAADSSSQSQQQQQQPLTSSSTSIASSQTSPSDLTTSHQQKQPIPDVDLTPLPNVPEDINVVELVPQLTSHVMNLNKSQFERIRTRALLHHVYHLALHDKYFEARDRMLATRIQDDINATNDTENQIHFNRTLVQLGLAAFRKGRINDAHVALTEIVGPRIKELLAQGIVTGKHVGERTAEQEKLEKRRQMPYYLHINLDMVEFAQLTCAMLIEVPIMSTIDPRRRVVSKRFRSVLDIADRQAFSGPPENTRDHIIAAGKALIQSDWELCSDLLLRLESIWKLIPKDDRDQVKATLKRKIQEEALRTHLFTNAQYYETIKLEELVQMFQLSPNSVHAIVCKMISTEELLASLDQPSQSITLNGNAPSHIQQLALQFSEKIASLFEYMDNQDSQSSQSGQSGRQGGYNKQQQWQQQQQQQQGQQGSESGGSQNVSGGYQERGHHHHHHHHHGHHQRGPSSGDRKRGGGGGDEGGQRNDYGERREKSRSSGGGYQQSSGSDSSSHNNNQGNYNRKQGSGDHRSSPSGGSKGGGQQNYTNKKRTQQH